MTDLKSVNMFSFLKCVQKISKKKQIKKTYIQKWLLVLQYEYMYCILSITTTTDEIIDPSIEIKYAKVKLK